MSTNPNNAVGTNGAYGGRTSVDAFNDVINVFQGAGILSGWQCSPSSGMTVQLGGVTGYRDVAVATAPGGSRTTINNRTSNPISVTLDTAPATNSRIDVIVAYVANPPQGSSTVTDNPAACGIIAVKGTSSSSPTAPTDSDIRTAITADGATGSTAYYVVLATISVAANVTTITSNYITQGARATLGTNNIANGAVTSDKIDFTTINFTASSPKIVYQLNGKDVYRVYVSGTTSSGSNTQVEINTGGMGVRLCGHQIYVMSEYGQAWNVPNYFVDSEGYRNSIYQAIDGHTSSLFIEMPMGSYLRSQPYWGYVDYYFI